MSGTHPHGPDCCEVHTPDASANALALQRELHNQEARAERAEATLREVEWVAKQWKQALDFSIPSADSARDERRLNQLLRALAGPPAELPDPLGAEGIPSTGWSPR